jgi:hypothetical protein
MPFITVDHFDVRDGAGESGAILHEKPFSPVFQHVPRPLKNRERHKLPLYPGECCQTNRPNTSPVPGIFDCGKPLRDAAHFSSFPDLFSPGFHMCGEVLESTPN